MICRHLTKETGAFEATKKGCRCTRCGLELNPGQAIKTNVLMDRIPTCIKPEISRAISIDIMLAGNTVWEEGDRNKYMTEVLNSAWHIYLIEKDMEGGKKYA